MHSYPNIESRKFPGRDHYVAYGAGEIWHVKKINKTWIARLVSLNRRPLPLTLTAPTLRDMSAQLARVA